MSRPERTVPKPLDGETSTSRSRLSHGSSSQGHVSPVHVDREEAPTTYDGLLPLADPYPGGPSDTSLLIYYRDYVVRYV